MKHLFALTLISLIASPALADTAADTAPLPPEKFSKTAEAYRVSLSENQRVILASFIETLPAPCAPEIETLLTKVRDPQSPILLRDLSSILNSPGVQAVCQDLLSHDDPLLRFIVSFPLIAGGNTDAARQMHNVIHSPDPTPLQKQLIASWCAGIGIRAQTDTPAEIFEHLRRASSDQPLLKPGDVAPEFKLTTTSGETLRLADHKGKVVVLHFWATWCGPCMDEMDLLKHQLKDYPPEIVTIISVSLDYDQPSFEKAAAELQLPWHVAQESAGWGADIARAYGINQLPYEFVIDPQGKLTSNHVEDIPKAIPGNDVPELP